MKDVLLFMGEHPWLTFLCCFVLLAIVRTTIIHLTHHMNIRKHGYPPPHCDADGDLKPQPEDDED